MKIHCEPKGIDRESLVSYFGWFLGAISAYSYDALINKLTQVCRVLSIIRHHLPREMLIQFFNAHFMSHLHYSSFIYARLKGFELMRIQRLQNRCVKQIFFLHPRHPTSELYKNIMPKTLPVIGIVYSSMILAIHKSRILNREELLNFEVNRSNRRSSGMLIPSRFKKVSCLGTDITCLGVKLYNQLGKKNQINKKSTKI